MRCDLSRSGIKTVGSKRSGLGQDRYTREGMKALLPLCAINLALSVALGAFGAHSLRDRIGPADLVIYHTGSQYHMIQGLGALLALVLATQVKNPKRAIIATWLLLIGGWIFAGSLYVLAISGLRMLGAITPLGGLAFISGWIVLATAGVKEVE